MQGELLYQMKLKFLPMVVMGVTPEGMRINVPFNGEVTGKTIKGKIEGTDFVTLGSDGVGRLHIHAVVTTDAGDLVAIQAIGTSIAAPDGRNVIKEAITYQTGSEQLAWLNSTLAVADGFADLSTNELEARIYKF